MLLYFHKFKYRNGIRTESVVWNLWLLLSFIHLYIYLCIRFSASSSAFLMTRAIESHEKALNLRYSKYMYVYIYKCGWHKFHANSQTAALKMKIWLKKAHTKI